MAKTMLITGASSGIGKDCLSGLFLQPQFRPSMSRRQKHFRGFTLFNRPVGFIFEYVANSLIRTVVLGFNFRLVGNERIVHVTSCIYSSGGHEHGKRKEGSLSYRFQSRNRF